MLEEAIGNIYESGAYMGSNPDWHEGDALFKASVVSALISNEGLHPKVVADVGCGTGGVLDRLGSQLDADTQLVGFEPSPEAAARARALRPRMDIRESFIQSTREHFDLMLVLDVIEHVDDYLGFLRSLRGRAQDYIFHIPLDMNVQWLSRLKPIIQQRESVGHLHYFCRDTALATLHYAGFAPVAERYTPGAVATPKSTKARIAAAPRRASHGMAPHWTARLLGGYSLLVLARDS